LILSIICKSEICRIVVLLIPVNMIYLHFSRINIMRESVDDAVRSIEHVSDVDNTVLLAATVGAFTPSSPACLSRIESSPPPV
jgi:hypothetical protein